MTALGGIDALLGIVRLALLGTAGVFAVFCLLDWAVRTRRINVFGSIARFTRARIDPVIAPMERRVVRAGGNPASAPLWSLVVVVVGGILLISVLDFLRGQIIGAVFAFQVGPAGVFRLLVRWTFDILQIALIVRVVSSWLPISPYSRWVHWSFVLSEPILRPLRQIIPTLGMIDITPIVAYFLLGFLQGAVMRML